MTNSTDDINPSETETNTTIDKAELLKRIDYALMNLDDLPPLAMATYLTHYDYKLLLSLIGDVLRSVS